MTKKAILVASFGTSCVDTLEKTIAAVEKRIQKEYFGFEVRRAFTSSMVIKKLSEAGVNVDSVSKALERLYGDGFEEVYVVPTHIIAGSEYEKLKAQAEMFIKNFGTLKIGKPLIHTTKDMETIVNIIAENIAPRKDSALVLMGHGTKHCMNSVYSAMDYMFKEKGFENIFMGTVEAYPLAANVLNLVKKAGYSKALIAPFMLVAGVHAKNDMAGSGESWKSKFNENGIAAEVVLKGLGEYEQIQGMYAERAGSVLGGGNG